MTDTQQPTLSNKYVWIVDDAIPVYALDDLDIDCEDMIDGSRPIDRSVLMTLLKKTDVIWEDEAVKVLCDELVRNAADVLAFPQPTAAVDYLQKRRDIPDLIVYDLAYQTCGMPQVITHLQDILTKCVSVVQVYTKESLEVANGHIGPLKDRFSTRLRPVLNKESVSTAELATKLAERTESSLSARLAARIRRLSSDAIERILVKVDDLPLDVAIRLLAGEPELPSVDTEEFVELLSIKVAEILKSDPVLNIAVQDFAGSKEVPVEKTSQFVGEMVELLASGVRERIQYEGWLYDAIRRASETCITNRSTTSSQNHSDIIRDFFAFRLYDIPGDDLVRTGDIMAFVNDDEEFQEDPPILHLVLSPPCDLAQFWYKTWGVITMTKMYPLKDGNVTYMGIHKATSYTHSGPDSASITNRNPMLLPSVYLSDTRRLDYALFVHDIEHIEFDGNPLINGLEGKAARRRVSTPVLYEELKIKGGHYKRLCRISEPFLTGILADLRNSLFRSGVPNFPDEERERLKGLFR